jgi:hypothetical protein
MNKDNDLLAGDIYYETSLSVPEQLELLKPLLQVWIGQDYMQYYVPGAQFLYYHPEDAKIHLSVGWNAGRGKSSYDNDRFRCRLGYTDETGQLTKEQYLRRMVQALELFWSHGIPTCTPGWEDELPNHGGEDGPIPWPPWP